MPASVVVAQACAHNHPGSEKDAADVERWLQAACILAGKDAVALGLLTAEGKLVAPIGAEGFLVHLGDHDWVLSGFAAARCVAYLRDYAKRSFGTLPEARFNALRNYVGSRVSYMRLYQAIAQGGADALMASVVKAQACLRRAAGKMREAWRERAPTPAAVGFAFHRRRMVDLVAPADKIKARQAPAQGSSGNVGWQEPSAGIWESRRRFFMCARPALYQMLQKHPVSSAILNMIPGRGAVR